MIPARLKEIFGTILQQRLPIDARMTELVKQQHKTRYDLARRMATLVKETKLNWEQGETRLQKARPKRGLFEVLPEDEDCLKW